MEKRDKDVSQMPAKSGEQIVFDNKELKGALDLTALFPSISLKSSFSQKSLEKCLYYDRLDILCLMEKTQIVCLRHSFLAKAAGVIKGDTASSEFGPEFMNTSTDYFKINFDVELKAMYKDEEETLLCVLGSNNQLLMIELEEFKKAANYEAKKINFLGNTHEVAKLVVIDKSALLVLTDKGGLCLVKSNEESVTLSRQCSQFSYDRPNGVLYILVDGTLEVYTNFSYNSPPVPLRPSKSISLLLLANSKPYFMQHFQNNVFIIASSDENAFDAVVVHFHKLNNFSDFDLLLSKDIFIFDTTFMEEDEQPGRFEFSFVHYPEQNLIAFYGNISSSLRLFCYEFQDQQSNPLTSNTPKPMTIYLVDIDDSKLPTVENVGHSEGVVCGAFLLRKWLLAKDEVSLTKTHATFKSEATGEPTKIPTPPKMLFLDNGGKLLIRLFEDYRLDKRGVPRSIARLKEPLNVLSGISKNVKVSVSQDTVSKILASKPDSTKTDPLKAVQPSPISNESATSIFGGLQAKPIATDFKASLFGLDKPKVANEQPEQKDPITDQVNPFKGSSTPNASPFFPFSKTTPTDTFPKPTQTPLFIPPVFIQPVFSFDTQKPTELKPPEVKPKDSSIGASNQLLPDAKKSTNIATPVSGSSFQPFGLTKDAKTDKTISDAPEAESQQPITPGFKTPEARENKTALSQNDSEAVAPLTQKTSHGRFYQTQNELFKGLSTVLEPEIISSFTSFVDTLNHINILNIQSEAESPFVKYVKGLKQKVSPQSKKPLKPIEWKGVVENLLFTCQHLHKVLNLEAGSPSYKSQWRDVNLDQRSFDEIQRCYQEHTMNLESLMNLFRRFKMLADIFLESKGLLNYGRDLAQQPKPLTNSRCLLNKQLFYSQGQPPFPSNIDKLRGKNTLCLKPDPAKMSKPMSNFEVFTINFAPAKTGRLLAAHSDQILCTHIKQQVSEYHDKLSKLLHEIVPMANEVDSLGLNKTACISVHFDEIDSVDMAEPQMPAHTKGIDFCTNYYKYKKKAESRNKLYEELRSTKLPKESVKLFDFTTAPPKIRTVKAKKERPVVSDQPNARLPAPAPAKKPVTPLFAPQLNISEPTSVAPKPSPDFLSQNVSSKTSSDPIKKIFASNTNNYIEAITNPSLFGPKKDPAKPEAPKKVVGAEPADKREQPYTPNLSFNTFPDSSANSKIHGLPAESKLLPAPPKATVGQVNESNQPTIVPSDNKNPTKVPPIMEADASSRPVESRPQATMANTSTKPLFDLPLLTNGNAQKTPGQPPQSLPSDKLPADRNLSPAKDITNATQVVSEVMLDNLVPKSTPDNKQSMVITTRTFNPPRMESIGNDIKNNLASNDSIKAKGMGHLMFNQARSDRPDLLNTNFPSNFQPSNQASIFLAGSKQDNLSMVADPSKANIFKEDLDSVGPLPKSNTSGFDNLLSNDNKQKLPPVEHSKKPDSLFDASKRTNSLLANPVTTSFFKDNKAVSGPTMDNSKEGNNVSNKDITKKLISNIELRPESSIANPETQGPKNTPATPQNGQPSGVGFNSPKLNPENQKKSQASDVNQLNSQYQTPEFQGNQQSHTNKLEGSFALQEAKAPNLSNFAPSPNTFPTDKPFSHQPSKPSIFNIQNLHQTSSNQQNALQEEAIAKSTNFTTASLHNFNNPNPVQQPAPVICLQFGAHNALPPQSNPQEPMATTEFSFRDTNPSPFSSIGQPPMPSFSFLNSNQPGSSQPTPDHSNPFANMGKGPQPRPLQPTQHLFPGQPQAPQAPENPSSSLYKPRK